MFTEDKLQKDNSVDSEEEEDKPPDDDPSDDVSDNLLLWIEKKDK
tara:strand:+ start:176 stop:310 length:135 start_codon:yes stop_codon:yes gene_type:complete